MSRSATSFLNHHHKAVHSGTVGKHFQQERRSDVVGKIGNQRPGSLPEVIRKDGQRIAKPNLDTVEPFQDFRQQRAQSLVHFVGNHLKTGHPQGFGQGAGSGTNLNDPFTGFKADQSNQFGYQIGVGQEVLTESLAGNKIVSGQEFLDGSLALGHGRNMRRAFSLVNLATSSSVVSQTPARAAPTRATRDGSFGSPR